MKTTRERIKNSIRAYIIGDVLGLPFEFKREGNFLCRGFSSGGVHNKPKGFWSDDTSVLLCLLDAFSKNGLTAVKFNQFVENLNSWYHNKGFNAGLKFFDMGMQTMRSIAQGGCEETDRMGNGALFYCLPIAAFSLNQSDEETKELFKLFCSYTHNNQNCFDFGTKFCCILKKLLRDLPTENIRVEDYDNLGDVINTYNLVIDNYLTLENKSSSLFEDLCQVVNCGFDTDTNAALFGSLIGTKKKINERDWKQVVKYKEIDKLIDKFIFRCC